MEASSLAIEHLLLRLRGLNRALQVAVARQQTAAERYARPGVAPLCITNEHVAALLTDVNALAADRKAESVALPCAIDARELETQDELRARASKKGFALPLEVLSKSLSLLPFEETAILACVAPELDRSYGRIYGYVLDDLNRQQPSVELICMLGAESPARQLALRRGLGRFGRLRRSGILQPIGQSAIEARQELRLAPVVLDFLLGAPCDPTGFFRDRAEVLIPTKFKLPPDVSSGVIERLAESIGEGQLSLIGVWGPRHCGKEEVLFAVANAARRPLRRLNLNTNTSNAELSTGLWEEVQIASALDALVWIETDWLQDPEQEDTRRSLIDALASSRIPAFLTGTHPWRPVRLLESRGYTEFELPAPAFQFRKALWAETLPQVVEPQISSLASRFRMSPEEMRAAAHLARTSAALKSNGHRVRPSDDLEAACAAVTRKRSDHFATVVKPRRTPEDLVLPTEVHRQVVEIARFFKASAQVDEEWGFGRITHGGGIKVLFTGEPGTGKTLAAEVIAGALGLPLLKVDLARVVSKWVGETEKNLDTVFREAEESHSVLFFDEADSLFGKRAEVQHGTDRYANLEVGFLLQRLEDYFGLVILASNLKEQIDAAFTRRFHVIVHFPLPRPAERRRIWELAFPASAPTQGRVDLDMLMQLDMTGASIVSAARTAALLAADENSPSISMAHVVRGIARQFHREARILPKSALGSHGSLLQDAP